MITLVAEAVLMKGKGETLEAIERVCDKRSMRGASCDDIIAYLDHLLTKDDGEYLKNSYLERGIETLKSYWIARKG